MARNISMVLAVALVLSGCDMAKTQEVQYDDSRNPFYQQAQQDLDNNNPAAAAADYEKALGANPKLVEAHYQLGHIYSEKLNDPIAAIFHFQQYVKLAPNGDKTPEVKDLIDKLSHDFAASLPNSTTQNADDYAKLQADNASLKKQLDDATRTIAQLQAQLSQHHPAASTPVTATPPVPVAPVAAATGNAPGNPGPANDSSAASPTNAVASTPPRALPLDATNAIAGSAPNMADSGPSKTYTVVKGDSIWKIAHKMYPGDTKNGMDKIQEANKDVLTGKPLKIGQVLIIPQ